MDTFEDKCPSCPKTGYCDCGKSKTNPIKLSLFTKLLMIFSFIMMVEIIAIYIVTVNQKQTKVSTVEQTIKVERMIIDWIKSDRSEPLIICHDDLK